MANGIDISEWQDSIDWDDMISNGAEFAIMRIGRTGSSGNPVLDTKFVEHINNAIAKGLQVGVYYYSKATTEAEAKTEATWLADTLNTYCKGTTLAKGIWLDAEDPDTMGKLDGTALTAVCSKFIVTMNEAGFTNVGIYASYAWFTDRIQTSQLADYVPFWVAQYNSTMDFADARVKLWQNTDKAFGMSLDGDKDV